MNGEEIDLPVDPEDGLTPNSVSALYTFTLAPADELDRLHRSDVLQAWLEWCFEKDITRESTVDVAVVSRSDGSLHVRPLAAKPRSPAAGDRLSRDLQRSLLECATPGADEVQSVIALACLDELVSDLVGVMVDDEQLFGHLALVHGLITDTAMDHNTRVDIHRDSHRIEDGYGGHHAVGVEQAYRRVKCDPRSSDN